MPIRPPQHVVDALSRLVAADEVQEMERLLREPVRSEGPLTMASMIMRPSLLDSGEGPSPALVRDSQTGFGQGLAANPAVAAAQTTMNANLRTLIEVDEAAAWPARTDAILSRQNLRDALRSNDPNVSMDVLPDRAYVEFRYRDEYLRVAYPYATVPDLPAIRDQAIRHLTPTNNMTATEVRMRQAAAVSRAADVGRMWHDEAANITADMWSSLGSDSPFAQQIREQAARLTTSGTTTNTIRMEDIDRAVRSLDATPEIRGTRVNLNRSYVDRNANGANADVARTGIQAYTPPTDPEAVAKALGVVEDQTLAALRKLKQLGWVWDGKDWVYRMT